MKKGVIYARVSTHREEQQSSLHNQIVLAENVAKENNIQIVGRYIENGVSGTGIKNRLEMNNLLDDAKTGKFDVVISKSVSRLGRNMIQSMKTANELERMNIRLILPEDSYDSDTSTTRLMFNLKAVFAEEESAKLSERTKLGIQAKAREGKVHCSMAPYGYVVNRETLKLELNEECAPIVKDIFDYYLHKGWGMSKIGNHLMRLKIPTPNTISGASNGGTRWHQNTISSILTNPAYTGRLVQHRTESTQHLAESETYRLRREVPLEDQIVIENAHPAIISQEQFEAIQATIKARRRTSYNGKESLFANIAECSDCGSGMHFKADRRKGAYVCGGYVKHTTSYCSSHIIAERVLLAAVKKDIAALIEDEGNIDELYGMAKEEASNTHTETLKKYKQTERQIKKLNQQFNSLLSLHADGAITTEQFKERNSSLSEQQQELTNKQTEYELQLDERKDQDKSIRVFRKTVKDFLNLDIEDQDDLKQVLQRLIKKIIVFNEDKIVIHYNLVP